mmetsp:Transcript_72067/g.166984  ORF Transcript_72067/g.166984 Transcript_72067/m.166984 type:complete len:213 (-) Transcript_72067:8-646(-)
MPSWAFHSTCFWPAWMDLRCTLSLQANIRCSQSGDHTTAYTACGICVSVERSMPERDQTFTEPSSPEVAMALPSKLHFKEMTAPRCASTLFSSRPCSLMRRKVPSAQPKAKVLSELLLPGHQAMDVAKESSWQSFELGEPSTSHFQQTWSSPQESSSYCLVVLYQPTAVTSELCFGVSSWVIFNRIALGPGSTPAQPRAAFRPRPVRPTAAS